MSKEQLKTMAVAVIAERDALRAINAELLEALLDMVSVYSGQVQNNGEYTVLDTIARAAIAKATKTQG